MTHVRELSNAAVWMKWLAILAVSAALSIIAVAPAGAAAVAPQEDSVSGEPEEREAVPEGTTTERVVVDPDPDWSGWHDGEEWHYRSHAGGLRVDAWVDRGDYATYETGDRMWVYFRVNRPCYVTIIDYTTDGRVETLYPNRWSSSSMFHPGRVYRVPDDGRFSLRIAGPGGIETLVVCAHELPWPSGPHGIVVPGYHEWSPGAWTRGVVVPGRDRRPHGRVVTRSGHRGRVVVGGERGRVHPERGRTQRVVVSPQWWPVPVAWHDVPRRWACDSVTFRVIERGYWGGDWDDDWSDWGHDWDDWDAGGGTWHDPDSWWGGHHAGFIRERFTLNRPSDEYHESIVVDGRRAHITVSCTESNRGDPTELVARITWDGGWPAETICRIDAEGRHGDVPRRGEVYVVDSGPVRAEIEIIDFELTRAKPWRPHRIDWIRFDVRARAF